MRSGMQPCLVLPARLSPLPGCGLGLDFVFFASWQGHPTFNLPETNRSSYTGIIHDYIRQNSRALPP